MKRIRSSKKWQRHSYNKPRRVQRAYYSEQDKKEKNSVIKIIWFIFFLLIIQALGHASVFKIKEISLENNKELSLLEIEEIINPFLNTKRLFIFKNSNYFLINKSYLINLLSTEYNLETINIKKVFPNKLKIIVQERISSFIWQKDDSLYLLTSQGTLNHKIRDLNENYDNYPILIDFRAQEANKEQIFNDLELNYINTMYLLWQEVIGDKIKIKKMYIEDSKDFKVEINLGYNIIFNKEKDIKEQLNNLNKVLAESIIGAEVDYIDLRFGDKVYFK